LWDACKAACSQNEAILVHCNQSFHRGPVLLAVMMVKSGMSVSEAMEYIGAGRAIYGGHFLAHQLWPESERDDRHAPKFLEAQRFLTTFSSNSPRRPARGLQPGAAARSQKAPKQQQPVSPHKAPKARSQTPAAATGSQPGSTPPSPTGSHPQSIPAAACGSQPESIPAAASGLQPGSPPPVASGLQPEPAAAIAEDEDKGDWDRDDDKSSVWTDEEEHEAWGKMSIDERLGHFSVMKRQQAWFTKKAEADIGGGLQPGIKIPKDISDFLKKHQLRHRSHPSAIIKGRKHN
jgi:hypothetical protein